MKNRVIIIILAVLSIAFFITTISSCNNAMRQKAARDQEMAARIQMEEKMSRFSQERSALEEKIKAKEKEVEEARAALEEARSASSKEHPVPQPVEDGSQKGN